MTGRAGAFLDRDGTIIRDAEYLADPDKVELLPGAAAAIARLNAAKVATIVVTNQSGIARGLFTEEQYEAVHARLDELLAAQGARITEAFHCPHHPDYDPPCECRKPGLLLYRLAIEKYAIDPRRSLFAGDRWRDVQPGLDLGGFVAMIPNDSTPIDERNMAEREERVRIVESLSEAVDLFLAALPKLPMLAGPS